MMPNFLSEKYFSSLHVLQPDQPCRASSSHSWGHTLYYQTHTTLLKLILSQCEPRARTALTNPGGAGCVHFLGDPSSRATGTMLCRALSGQDLSCSWDTQRVHLHPPTFHQVSPKAPNRPAAAACSSPPAPWNFKGCISLSCSPAQHPHKAGQQVHQQGWQHGNGTSFAADCLAFHIDKENRNSPFVYVSNCSSEYLTISIDFKHHVRTS